MIDNTSLIRRVIGAVTDRPIEDTGSLDVYRASADGSDPVRLTADPSVDIAYSFSPDGHRIAFHSERDLNLEVYTMAADGSDVRRLTYGFASDGFPSWSPDGNTIAFSSDRDGSFDIYAMAPDGSDQR
ncbi:MAG: hypothetical protein M3R57_03040, partial [Chloroflexota bacterium]|nr:hypothetical protein [Chloroflexota bacterium]